MVKTCSQQRRHEGGALITEIVIAMSILVIAVMPVAFTYLDHQKQVRRLYQKSVMMEVIDGEMEILAAGEWRSYKNGPQPYSLEQSAVKNLPKGAAQLTIDGKRLRLEWVPQNPQKDTAVVREATIP